MANNNDDYFNAALAAACGGPATGRYKNSSTATDYSVEKNSAIAFATEVDSLIPLDASVSAGRANLLQAICAALLSARYISSATAADYATIAADVVAFFTEVKTSVA